MSRNRLTSLAAAAFAAAGLVPLWPAPALATLNWDYRCTADDEHVGLDLTLKFTTPGNVGVISLVNIAGEIAVKDSAGKISFAKDDVHQFWTMDSEFKLYAGQLSPEDQQLTRLQIDTSCKERVCTGTYFLGYRGKPMDGPISCKQSEIG